MDGRESSDEKRKVETMQNGPDSFPSIVDIVVAMNDKILKAIGAQKINITGVLYH